MRKIFLSSLLVAGAVSMSACSTLRGAAIGGAGGAGVAAATGKNVEKAAAVSTSACSTLRGAAIGGAGGAGVAAATGGSVEKGAAVGGVGGAVVGTVVD